MKSIPVRDSTVPVDHAAVVNVFGEVVVRQVQDAPGREPLHRRIVEGFKVKIWPKSTALKDQINPGSPVGIHGVFVNMV